MSFISPSLDKYTVYSKDKCGYCTRVKNLLIKNSIKFTEINCDKYLQEDKDGFLEFIKNLTGKDIKTFPIVFMNNEYIGGYNETNIIVEETKKPGDLDFNMLF